VIVGAAKSGTTTLYRWLTAQPEVFHARPKEPHYFSGAWRRGPDWYESIYADAPQGSVAGDASTSYTDPAQAVVAAERMAAVLPDARLIYVVRHPIERALSHYRHERRRARTALSWAEVSADQHGRVVGSSFYHARLAPYIERYPAEQICVVRFEDLVATDGPGWTRVLTHLGLAPRPAPGTAHNVTAAAPALPPLLRRLSDARKRGRFPTPPRAARAAGRRLIRRRSRPFADPVDDSDVLPAPTEAALWADVARLEAWLGTGPLWPRSAITDD
jgi:hypothetical protein